MKRFVPIMFLIFTVFFLVRTSSAYIDNSLRIRALGDELVGVLRDDYSDIHRNPAFLSYLTKTKIFGQYSRSSGGVPKIVVRSIEIPKPEIVGGYYEPAGKGNSILAGLAWTFSPFGNFAFVGERQLQADESISKSETYQIPYISKRYVYRYSDKSKYNRYSLSGFKGIYSLVFSSLKLGLEYSYSKVGNRYVSDYQDVVIDRWAEDDRLYWIYEGNRISKRDYVTKVKKLGAGIGLSPLDSKIAYDFVLSYSEIRDCETEVNDNYRQDERFRREDSLLSHVDFDWESNPVDMPRKSDIWELNGNMKYNLSDETTVTLLLTVSYQKNKLSGWKLQSKTRRMQSWIPEDSIFDITSQHTNYRNQDKSILFLVGTGVEKDFSSIVKLGVALKGYADRIEFDHYQITDYYTKSVREDSVLYEGEWTAESKVNKTKTSYGVIFPAGLEFTFRKNVFFRVGTNTVYRRDEYINSSGMNGYVDAWSESVNTSYSFGIGFKHKQKLSVDAYTVKNLAEGQGWHIAFEYNL